MNRKIGDQTMPSITTAWRQENTTLQEIMLDSFSNIPGP